MLGTRIAHAILCAILFACSAVLLGLTAYHVHVTESSVGFYVPIVVELLVTSCLAVIVSLWFFVAIILHVGGRNSYGVEIFLLIVIWFMFLVGASVFSRGWHNISWCASSRHACQILSAIIAFSWINFSFTTGMLIACIADMESSRTDVPRGRPVQPETGQIAPTNPATQTIEDPSH